MTPILEYWEKQAEKLSPPRWNEALERTWPHCPACWGNLRPDLEWPCCSNRRCPFGFETHGEYHVVMYKRRDAEGERQHTRKYDVQRWVRAVQNAQWWLARPSSAASNED